MTTENSRLTPRQINTLRSAYASVKRCTPEQLKQMKRSLANLHPDSLAALASSGIPFVQTAANSVLCDKGIRPESARWEHGIDVATDSLLAQNGRAMIGGAA